MEEIKALFDKHNSLWDDNSGEWFMDFADFETAIKEYEAKSHAENCYPGGVSGDGKGWRLIKDGLPEDEDIYIIFLDKVRIASFSFGCFSITGPGGSTGCLKNVSHWMPLPKPPCG